MLCYGKDMSNVTAGNLLPSIAKEVFLWFSIYYKICAEISTSVRVKLNNL